MITNRILYVYLCLQETRQQPVAACPLCSLVQWIAKKFSSNPQNAWIFLKIGWHSRESSVKFAKKLRDILLKVMWKSQKLREILSQMCVQFFQKCVKFSQKLPEILLKIG